MGLPADLVRSVEVHVVNQTRFALSVGSCGLFEACKWLPDETPSQGAVVAQYQDVIWGVYTQAAEASANATICLLGLGDGPATINVLIGANGVPSCVFNPNSGLGGTVTRVDSGSGDNAQFQLVLIQQP